jgi:hypothetical protein
LGRPGVLAGQNLDPIPPARTTAQSRSGEDLIDTGEELIRAEGFSKEIERSQLEGSFAVSILTLGGEYDDRGVAAVG